MTQTQLLAGRHAVVTGGGRGIGAAIAGALARHGAAVTVFGRNAPGLASTVAALASSAPCGWELADVRDDAALAGAFERAAALRGPVAILVNNAGVARSAPFARTDDALWRELLDVNLTGVFHACRAVLPGMVNAGFGRIVNVASTAGLVGYPYVAAYCAAKHGAVGLTRALALEVATAGVTVNAVCPGYTDTDMVADAVTNIVAKTGRTVDQARAALVERNPQMRLVTPEEVANAIAWLCLPGAEAVTGQAISVSGGEVMAG